MRRVYKTVDDVDLYIGGVSEIPVEGSILGPTFLCLIGDQMARLRRGDRYYFEEVTAEFTSRKCFLNKCLLRTDAFPLNRANCQLAKSFLGTHSLRQWRRHQSDSTTRVL